LETVPEESGHSAEEVVCPTTLAPQSRPCDGELTCRSCGDGGTSHGAIAQYLCKANREHKNTLLAFMTSAYSVEVSFLAALAGFIILDKKDLVGLDDLAVKRIAAFSR
jgi:hypothetical protein